jgi:hypothetical protein
VVVEGLVAMDHRLAEESWPPDQSAGREDGDAREALIEATERLRAEISRASLPFDLAGAAEVRHEREMLLQQLDGYVLPRLRRMDAPLLVVIGGSTGAGKSTLTNSLVGVPVSPAGVLRPTTRSPVLVHHPADGSMFMSRRILPGLVRIPATGGSAGAAGSGGAMDGVRTADPNSLRVVAHRSVAPGLAIIDSPDLDSLVEENRALAQLLFGAADLWLFVTTGTEYADAVPWALLTEAVDRRVSVAVVLDRMRDSEVAAVRVHFATMLRDRGLASAPLFVIPETTLVDGLLPPKAIASLGRWLREQASDPDSRDGHIGRGVVGALDQVRRRVRALADAAADQAMADRLLRADLNVYLDEARQEIEQEIAEGSVVDAQVEAAWQAVRDLTEATAGAGRSRWRLGGHPRGGSERYLAVGETLVVAVTELVRERVEGALDRMVAHRQGHPVVADGLVGHPELTRLPADFTTRFAGSLRDWQAGVHGRVHPRPGRWRAPAAADPSVAAVTTLAVGVDDAWIAELTHRLLEAEAPHLDVPGEVATAVEDLRQRVADELAVQRGRLHALLDDAGGGQGGQGLRSAAEAVNAALGSAPPP